MVTVLQKTPQLYRDSEDVFKAIPQHSMKEELMNVREDIELNEICLMIHPNVSSSLKKSTAKSYPSGGLKTSISSTAAGGRDRRPGVPKRTNTGLNPPAKKATTKVTNRNSTSERTAKPIQKPTKLVKQNSGPTTTTGMKKVNTGMSRKEKDVLECINAAQESVDRNLRQMRPNMVKRGKATPSTSSGGSGSNKGNEVKAKNYYD